MANIDLNLPFCKAMEKRHRILRGTLIALGAWSFLSMVYIYGACTESSPL